MVDLEIVSGKLDELSRRLERVRRFRDELVGDVEDPNEDIDYFELMVFNFQLSIQACIDIATHLIADEGWGAAPTTANAFRRLHEHGVLTQETATALGKAVGLRNLIAHVYGEVDPDRLVDTARHHLEDLETYAREIGRWIRSRS